MKMVAVVAMGFVMMGVMVVCDVRGNMMVLVLVPMVSMQMNTTGHCLQLLVSEFTFGHIGLPGDLVGADFLNRELQTLLLASSHRAGQELVRRLGTCNQGFQQCGIVRKDVVKLLYMGL